jgi:hypothetical protein
LLNQWDISTVEIRADLYGSALIEVEKIWVFSFFFLKRADRIFHFGNIINFIYKYKEVNLNNDKHNIINYKETTEVLHIINWNN